MSVEHEQRRAVVAEARRWLNTPYHNCADVLGAGVDCGMLIVRVFVDLGFAAPFDPRPYPPDWHLHRSDERYLGFLTDNLSETSAPDAGDVVVFRFGRCYSHGGIIASNSPLSLIHAYHAARIVLEEPIAQNVELSDPARRPRFFSYWAR